MNYQNYLIKMAHDDLGIPLETKFFVDEGEPVELTREQSKAANKRINDVVEATRVNAVSKPIPSFGFKDYSAGNPMPGFGFKYQPNVKPMPSLD